MKPYSFLSESSNNIDSVMLYHYETELLHFNNIKKSGRIISASFLNDPRGTYTERVKRYGYKDVNDFLRLKYNRLLKDARKKEWDGDYGVYFTPLDFFELGKNDKRYQAKYRITLDYANVSRYDVVWMVHDFVKLVNSKQHLQKLYNEFLSKIDNLKEYVNYQLFERNSKVKFSYLPQIIVFAGKDGIPVKQSNLEKKL